MDKVRLSNRLQQIAHFIPAETILLDIGTDHALLPVYAVQQGFVTKAFACDLNKGPLQAAKEQIKNAGLEERIETKLGNGLAVLQDIKGNDPITAVIAGMGGSLIRDILEKDSDKLSHSTVRRMILQPNVGEHHIRAWLLRSEEWFLSQETILEEDGKIYEILVADRHVDSKQRHAALYDVHLANDLGIPSDWMAPQLPDVLPVSTLLRMGPYLIRNPDEIWFLKWDVEWKKNLYVMEQLEQSNRSDAMERKKQRTDEWNIMREVWRCLQKQKQS